MYDLHFAAPKKLKRMIFVDSGIHTPFGFEPWSYGIYREIDSFRGVLVWEADLARKVDSLRIARLSVLLKKYMRPKSGSLQVGVVRHIHKCISACICVCIYIYTCICIHISTYIYIYICMVYVYTCTYVHTPAYTNTEVWNFLRLLGPSLASGTLLEGCQAAHFRTRLGLVSPSLFLPRTPSSGQLRSLRAGALSAYNLIGDFSNPKLLR